MNPRKCILETIVCNVETITTESRDGKLVYLDRVHGNKAFSIKQTGKLCQHRLSGYTLRHKGELYLVSGNTEKVTLEPVASYKLPVSMLSYKLEALLASNAWRIVYGPSDPKRPKLASKAKAKATKAVKLGKASKPWNESFGIRAARVFMNAKLAMDKAGFVYSLETEALFWECHRNYTDSLANRKADSFV